MIEAYSVSSVRAAETAAMGELPPGMLMDRAARGLADVVAVRLRERGGRRLVALVGGGDNGGDALFAVAALAEEGVAAAVVTLSEHPHAAGLAAVTEAGVEVVASLGSEAAPRAVELVEEADIVLDGILGIGGRPGLPPAAEAVVRAVPDESMVIAVDLPSGADPGGEVSASSMVFADETVTFGVAKPVHLLPATEPAVGVLTVVDIGVTVAGPAVVQRLTHDDAAALWPVPGPADDKYSRGVLGVVAGGEGYTGAPLLSVTAAVAAGAGMVRYVGPPTPTLLVRSTVPEAVHGVGRVQAWLVGPGLDAAEDTEHGRAQRRAALDALASGEPCVVDAGGLDLLERGPRPAPTLLTPHAGELARLLTRLDRPVERADVTADPVRHARRLAQLTGATVLLKGATTLVVDPGAAGLVRSQADAPPWMATAGSGDVLAGLAGTLLAAGLSPLDAGSLAALVHGLAGDAANPGGPVRALGVAHAIPVVVAGLLARGARRS